MTCGRNGCSDLTPCPACCHRIFDALTHDFERGETFTLRHPDGAQEIRRIDDRGRLHDDVDLPAYSVRYDGAARPHIIEHYEHGIWQDRGNAPARLTFYSNGLPHTVERSNAGRLSDMRSPEGLILPARAWFDQRGQLVHSESWIAGVRQ